MSATKNTFIFKLLLGHQKAFWLLSVFVLALCSLLLFLSNIGATSFYNYLIDLQAGPVPHVQIYHSPQPLKQKELLINSILENIGDIEKIRVAYKQDLNGQLAVRKIRQNDSTSQEQSARKAIRLEAIDLEYPPLTVMVEHDGKVFETTCNIFDTRYCHLHLPGNFKSRDTVIIRKIGYAERMTPVEWRFRIKRKISEPDLYLLGMAPRMEDPESIEDDMYDYRKDHSLSLFVPDMDSCLTEENKELLYMVANYPVVKPTESIEDIVEKIEKHGIGSVVRREIVSTKEVGVGYGLVSRPLLDDLNDLGLDKMIKKTIHLTSSSSKKKNNFSVLITGTFNAKLSKGKNDRILLLSLQGYNQLTGNDTFNTIDIRLRNPADARMVANEVKKFLSMKITNVEVSTWEEYLYEDATELIRFIRLLKQFIQAAICFICTACVLDMTAALYKNTMHHQMLLRLSGLKNLTSQYIQIGLLSASASICLFVLMIVSCGCIVVWLQIKTATVLPVLSLNYKQLILPLALQCIAPLLGSCFFGWYYGRKCLTDFVKS